MINLKLAYLNIFRNSRRTILTAACIVSGFLTIVMVGGYYEYNYWGLRESMIRSQLAHVQIYNVDYLKNKEINPFEFMMFNSDEIIELINEDPRVSIATKRLEFWGVLQSEGGEGKVVNIRGIQPENESLIFTFFTKKNGRELSSKSSGELEIGTPLADLEGLKVGDYLYLTTVTTSGEQNSDEYLLRGTVSSYSTKFDEVLVNMSFDDAAELVDIEGAQEIVVLLNKTNLTNDFVVDLKEKFLEKGWNLKVTTWLDQAGHYRQVVDYYSIFYRIILSISIVVAFFSSFNSLLMSTLERISEFGTMRSFGITKSSIFMILTMEAFILGVLSGVVASILSLLIVLLVDFFGGIPISAPPGLSTDIFIKILITPKLFLTGWVVALVVPMVALILVSVRTMGMKIIDQIKFNELN